MSSQEILYRNLVLEFEHKLDRRLETKEIEFIKWMAAQEKGDIPKLKMHLSHC